MCSLRGSIHTEALRHGGARLPAVFYAKCEFEYEVFTFNDIKLKNYSRQGGITGNVQFIFFLKKQMLSRDFTEDFSHSLADYGW